RIGRWGAGGDELSLASPSGLAAARHRRGDADPPPPAVDGSDRAAGQRSAPVAADRHQRSALRTRQAGARHLDRRARSEEAGTPPLAPSRSAPVPAGMDGGNGADPASAELLRRPA